MNKYKYVEESIKHYEKNVELFKSNKSKYVEKIASTKEPALGVLLTEMRQDGIAFDSPDCPLCKRFAKNVKLIRCLECPISEAGFSRCVGSPWENINKSIKDVCDVDTYLNNVEAALEAELNFLKSLEKKDEHTFKPKH